MSFVSSKRLQLIVALCLLFSGLTHAGKDKERETDSPTRNPTLPPTRQPTPAPSPAPTPEPTPQPTFQPTPPPPVGSTVSPTLNEIDEDWTTPVPTLNEIDEDWITLAPTLNEIDEEEVTTMAPTGNEIDEDPNFEGFDTQEPSMNDTPQGTETPATDQDSPNTETTSPNLTQTTEAPSTVSENAQSPTSAPGDDGIDFPKQATQTQEPELKDTAAPSTSPDSSKAGTTPPTDGQITKAPTTMTDDQQVPSLAPAAQSQVSSEPDVEETSVPTTSPVELPTDIRPVLLPDIIIGMMVKKEEALSFTKADATQIFKAFFHQVLLVQATFPNFHHVDIEVTNIEVATRESGRSLEGTVDDSVEINFDVSGAAYFQGSPVPSSDEIVSFLKEYFSRQGNLLLEVHLLSFEQTASATSIETIIAGEKFPKGSADGNDSEAEPSANAEPSNKDNGGLVAGVVLGVLILFVILLLVFWQRRKSAKKEPSAESTDGSATEPAAPNGDQDGAVEEQPFDDVSLDQSMMTSGTENSYSYIVRHLGTSSTPALPQRTDDDSVSLADSLYTTNTLESSFQNNGGPKQYNTNRLDKLLGVAKNRS